MNKTINNSLMQSNYKNINQTDISLIIDFENKLSNNHPSLSNKHLDPDLINIKKILSYNGVVNLEDIIKYNCKHTGINIIRHSDIHEFDFNHKDDGGENILFRLIRVGLDDLVLEFLIKFGTLLPLKDNNHSNQNILFVALNHNRPYLFKQFLYIANKMFDPKQVDINGETILFLATEDQDESVIEYILDTYSYECNLSATDEYGMTAFYHTILRGHIEIANKLIDEYESECRMSTIASSGVSAFDLAIFNKNYNLVEKMLPYISKYYKHRVSDEYNSPLMNLVENNKFDLIKRFVQKFDCPDLILDGINSDGDSAFSIACKKGFFEIAIFLFENYGDVVNIKTISNYETPLMKICKFPVTRILHQKQQILLIVKLLTHYSPESGWSKKLLLDFTNEQENNALMLACIAKNWKIAKILLEIGCPLNLEKRNKDGLNVLMIAIENNLRPIWQILLSKLKYPRKTLLEMNDKGESPLSIAFANNSVEIINNCNNLILFYTESDIDFFKKSMLWACKHNCTEYAKYLVDNFSTFIPKHLSSTDLCDYIYECIYSNADNIAEFLIENIGFIYERQTCETRKLNILEEAIEFEKYNLAHKIIDTFGSDSLSVCSCEDLDDFYNTLKAATESNQSTIIIKVLELMYENKAPKCTCNVCNYEIEDSDGGVIFLNDHQSPYFHHPQLILYGNEDVMIYLLDKHGLNIFYEHEYDEVLEHIIIANRATLFCDFFNRLSDDQKLDLVTNWTISNLRYLNLYIDKDNLPTDNNNLLMCAIEKNWDLEKVIKTIILPFVSLEQFNHKNRNEESVFDVCQRCKNFDFLKLIIDDAKFMIGHNKNFRKSLLSTTIEEKTEDLALDILTKYHKYFRNSQLTEHMRSLLSLSCENELESVAIKLLDTYQEDCYPFLKDSSCKTPFQIAQAKGLKKFIVAFKERFGKNHKNVQEYELKLIECIICHEETVINSLLNPCRHKDFCQICVNKLITCPLCRGQILNREEIEPLFEIK